MDKLHTNGKSKTVIGGGKCVKMDQMDEESNMCARNESEADSVKLMTEISSSCSNLDSDILESESCHSSEVSSVLSSESEISDQDATLCYGDSDSNIEMTPTKNTPQKAQQSPRSSVRSSLPHNEDACDGMTDCPTDYDIGSTGGSYHSNLAKQDQAGTEQSLSLGYHSYSPFEDSTETDILPLVSTVENVLRYNKDATKVSSQRPAFRNLPKPAIPQRKPIKLKINLKKKQCTLLYDSKTSFSHDSRVLNESNPLTNVNVTPSSRTIETPGSACTWVATPPTGLKLKLTKIQGTPRSELRSPLRQTQNTHTPKPRPHSPAGNNNWSVHRSGGLKLRFSTLKLTGEPVPHKVVDTNHTSLEHSPPSGGVGRPNKRRRKLTYEPGTLRW